MNNKKLIAYSLLAHINNTGSLVSGLLDIFIPVTKKALSELNKKGIYSGKNITEISKQINELFSLDIPIPVLRNILIKISKEVNTKDNNKFVIYNDNAFAIRNYTFDEFDNLLSEKEQQIKNIELLFKQFCEINKIEKKEYSSIFLFIEKNKNSIATYLNKPISSNHHDFSIEAQFVNFFRKIPEIYKVIQDLYLGAILSTYIEFSTEPIKQQIELLLDTNFIVSLIDLNTPESTNTCRQLIEIAKHNGYKLTVLKDTIEETQRLLLRRAEHFNESYLLKKINSEDIYNACDRRNLTKTDLENIADNLENKLASYGIFIIPHTEKYVNQAKYSKEYKKLQQYRNTKIAALHDAIAIYYVREKRNNKRYKAFEKVNCWFVNNAINSDYDDSGNSTILENGYQLEAIKVDTLINILWLSNPNINSKINSKDLINNGLTELIASTLNESLPKSSIIKELDDNIHKYAQDKLSDEQIVRVATRIANKQLINVEELNKIAKEDKEKFIKRLEEESKKQEIAEKNKLKKIEKFISALENEKEKVEREKEALNKKNQDIDKLTEELNESKQANIDKENKIRELKREKFIQNKIYRWRLKSWFEFFGSLLIAIIGIIMLLSVSGWDLKRAKETFLALKGNIIFSFVLSISGILFSAIVIKTLFNKYRNHSNIKAYIESIEMPDDFKPI